MKIGVFIVVVLVAIFLAWAMVVGIGNEDED